MTTESEADNMLTYSQAKEGIKELDRRGFENLIKLHGEEVIAAGLACGISLSDIEEAYQGEWNSDEAFVMQLLDDTGRVK